MRVRLEVLTSIGIAAAVCLTTADASAQDFHYGIRGGLNVSHVAFEADGVTVSPGSRAGLAIGGFLEGALRPEGWSVLTEALLSMKGSSLDTEGTRGKVRLIYLEVPVLARAALVGPRGTSLHLYAGPAFSLKLSEDVDRFDEVDGDDDLFKPLDVGLTFGGSVQIRNILLDVRYSLGLADIADEDDFDRDVSARNRTFSILVGWRLR